MRKKIKITVNGDDIEIKRPAKKTAHADIRAAVEAAGHDWCLAAVFVPNFPEKGRALGKSPRIMSMVAFG